MQPLMNMITFPARSRARIVALHGAIAMLAQQGGKLYVASELGDHAVIDLSIYQLPYCALMRRVWQSSPLVADRTRLLRRAAPREHRCAPSR